MTALAGGDLKLSKLSSIDNALISGLMDEET